jgi:glycosyltransferase involved in cell wall biosynthesis
MGSGKVSVIIPAYNNAEFLGQAIQSVLDQTYPFFEVVVVNDASPTDVSQVVHSFKDRRVRYLEHEVNRGLSEARNTGIRASEGEFIALLDGDDYFHPEKLKAHVEFLGQHPEIGATYNPRFELNHSSETIRELWRPPLTVGLKDLLFSYPFSPSDMVLRREWLFKVNLFDPHYVYVGEDLDLNCRLALAGCRFASVDRALNYRRYHSGRRVTDLAGAVENTIRPLNAAVSDARCPGKIRELQEKAMSGHYLLWSIIALTQDETSVGQKLLRAAVHGDPSFLDGEPCALTETMISYAIVDETMDHGNLLRRMAAQLPDEYRWPNTRCDWAVARGYLLRGTRAAMWGRDQDAQEHFRLAKDSHAEIDQPYIETVSAQLLSYAAEFGMNEARRVLKRLSLHLETIGGKYSAQCLKGCFWADLAFKDYNAGNFLPVPGEIVRALIGNPHHLKNRGVLSILLRSIGRIPIHCLKRLSNRDIHWAGEII